MAALHIGARMVVPRLLLVLIMVLKTVGCARDNATALQHTSYTSEASWELSAAESDLRTLVEENSLLIGGALAGATLGAIVGFFGTGELGGAVAGAAVGGVAGYAAGYIVDRAREARLQTEQATNIASDIKAEHRDRIAPLLQDDLSSTDALRLIDEKSRALDNIRLLDTIIERNKVLVGRIQSGLYQQDVSDNERTRLIQERRSLVDQNDQLKDQFGDIVEIVSKIDDKLAAGSV